MNSRAQQEGKLISEFWNKRCKNRSLKRVLMKRKRLSLIRRLSMPLPELQSYYREQRKREFLENSPMSRQIDFRKRTRPLFLGLLSVYLKIIGVKLTQMGKPCAVDDALVSMPARIIIDWILRCAFPLSVSPVGCLWVILMRRTRISMVSFFG